MDVESAEADVLGRETRIDRGSDGDGHAMHLPGLQNFARDEVGRHGVLQILRHRGQRLARRAVDLAPDVDPNAAFKAFFTTS